MREAERADAEPAAGAKPLAGAPVAIKDIIDVCGSPTKYGSPIYASAAPAAESAECVQALERAGAIVLGKTVTTEFAYYTPGKTRNPWNASHTPGGSSMGSAASVACGMAAGALGTQTNGSVIRPAAFCGIVGFKPSYGTVPNHGTLDPWPALDHTGVFARDVGDAALLASVITAPGTVTAGVLLPAHTLHLALVRSPVWHLAESPQKAMLASNATALRHAGAKIEELELPPAFEAAHRVHRTIMAYEGARHFAELQQRSRQLMSARFNELLDEGAAIPDSAYEEALGAADTLKRDFAAVLAGYDAIITPPAPGEAPATLDETGSPAFCTLWTLLGVPAITIPVGFGPSRLPLGLQIVGAYLADDVLLGAAAFCESHIPFHGL
jgi:Asp-tRNA(Asn)/Glu-tRNA(Gln) amidotransferase A subunit family amidase